MKNVVVAFLVAFVKSLFQDVVNNIWDNMWIQILEGIAIAEQKWKESGQGEKKKKFVMDKVMGYINSEVSLSWLQKKLVKLLLNNVIASIIDVINKNLDKNWIDNVQEIQEELEDSLAFII
jgi:uncharacterized membrane protein